MKLFLDACAIIYWVEMAEPYYGEFVNSLRAVRKKHKNTSFVASHLSLLECRIKPLREHDEKLLARYQQFFCAGDLELVPMSPDVIEKATELRAFHQIRTPDAIQAASALSLRDDFIFVTNDNQFKKLPKLNVLLM